MGSNVSKSALIDDQRVGSEIVRGGSEDGCRVTKFRHRSCLNDGHDQASRMQSE